MPSAFTEKEIQQIEKNDPACLRFTDRLPWRSSLSTWPVVELTQEDLNGKHTLRLFKALKKSKIIKEVFIQEEVGNTGFGQVLGLLKENTSIEEIDLGAMTLTDKNICKLAKVLEKNSSLKTLVLRPSIKSDKKNTIIDAEGAKALGKALKNNKTLIELDLADTSIGDEAMVYLAEGIKVNKTLQILDVSFSLVKDQGVKALQDVLEKNISLQYISLKPIDYSYKKALVKVLLSKVEKGTLKTDLSEDYIKDVLKDIEKLEGKEGSVRKIEGLLEEVPSSNTTAVTTTTSTTTVTTSSTSPKNIEAEEEWIDLGENTENSEWEIIDVQGLGSTS